MYEFKNSFGMLREGIFFEAISKPVPKWLLLTPLLNIYINQASLGVEVPGIRL